MSWNPYYVGLIFTTTLVSYITALIIGQTESKRIKKTALGAALVVSLGLLFFFKYFNFLADSVVTVLKKISIPANPISLNILLPVGISFYTFQTLSYVIDVYKGKVTPEKHFGIYATFVSFFPQLVAGPIERTENLLPQIKSEHKFNYEETAYGMRLMLWGFFKKMCIADYLATFVDKAYRDLEGTSGFMLILAMFLFSFVIYCDFSGYSDIAIGSAKIMGINLMKNFDSPYLSRSVKEFWSRWHISLSTWFKDYVYIPLGGNRCSKLRNRFNILVTFLVSGLWHGANWTFVIWGGIHGLGQIIESFFNNSLKKFRANKIGRIISVIFVFLFSSVAWVIFRAPTLSDGWYYLSHMFIGIGSKETYFANTLSLNSMIYARIFFLLLILTVFDIINLKTDVIKWLGEKHWLIRWTSYIVLGMIIFLFAQIGDTNFIYFQF